MTPYYFPVIGGIEELTKLMKCYLISEGKNVRIHTSDRYPSGKKIQNEKKIKGVHYYNSIYFGNYSFNYWVPQIKSSDLIIIQGFSHLCSYSTINSYGKKIPIIMFSHGIFPEGDINYISKVKRTLNNFLLLKFLQNIMLFFISNSYEKEWLSSRKVEKQKVKLINNPIDKIAFHKKNKATDSHYILFFGRISKEKNPLFPIDLMLNESIKKSNLNLIISGDYSTKKLRNDLQSYTKEKGLTDKVLFKGQIHGETKFIQYNKALCLIISSKTESKPLTIFECLSQNTPIVVPNNVEVDNQFKYGIFIYDYMDIHSCSKTILYIHDNYKKIINKIKKGNKDNLFSLHPNFIFKLLSREIDRIG